MADSGVDPHQLNIASKKQNPLKKNKIRFGNLGINDDRAETGDKQSYCGVGKFWRRI
jgi:hypothetical protein